MSCTAAAQQRGRLIWRIADLIEEHADEFATLEALDNGKPFKVARAADIPLSVDLFRYMAGWATKIEGEVVPISALTAPAEYMPTPGVSRLVSRRRSSRGTSRC